MSSEGIRPVQFQMRLPPDLYEWLRLHAFLQRISMTGIIAAALAAYRAMPEPAGAWAVPPRRAPNDPERVIRTFQVERELYEWARLAAFRGRHSINVLCVAALVAYRERCGDAAAPGPQS